MARYIILLNWTDQGLRGAKETVNRLNAVRQGAQALGARIVEFYWTLGPYDMVALAEAPDDETIYRLGLAAGMQGATRSVPLRAFNEQEMQGVIQGLP